MISFGFTLCFYGLSIAVLAGSVYAFLVGTRAFRYARTASGAQRQALRWLGLSLCEPIVNLPLIGLLFVSMSWRSLHQFWSAIGVNGRTALLIAPMSVLLLPALGLCVRDAFYRKMNLQILGMGIVRGLLVALSFWMSLSIFAALFSLLGTAFLWYSATWGSRLLARRTDGTDVMLYRIPYHRTAIEQSFHGLDINLIT